MNPVSAQVTERARKNHTLILQRLASVGQSQLAQALGVSESAVSRMKDKELADLSKLLAVLGLKVVPLEMRCFDAGGRAGQVAPGRHRAPRAARVGGVTCRPRGKF
jgi:hypothetical protein